MNRALILVIIALSPLTAVAQPLGNNLFDDNVYPYAINSLDQMPQWPSQTPQASAWLPYIMLGGFAIGFGIGYVASWDARHNNGRLWNLARNRTRNAINYLEERKVVICGAALCFTHLSVKNPEIIFSNIQNTVMGLIISGIAIPLGVFLGYGLSATRDAFTHFLHESAALHARDAFSHFTHQNNQGQWRLYDNIDLTLPMHIELRGFLERVNLEQAGRHEGAHEPANINSYLPTPTNMFHRFSNQVAKVNHNDRIDDASFILRELIPTQLRDTHRNYGAYLNGLMNAEDFLRNLEETHYGYEDNWRGLDEGEDGDNEDF